MGFLRIFRKLRRGLRGKNRPKYRSFADDMDLYRDQHEISPLIYILAMCVFAFVLHKYEEVRLTATHTKEQQLMNNGLYFAQ